jgi:hypothetical protein
MRASIARALTSARSAVAASPSPRARPMSVSARPRSASTVCPCAAHEEPGVGREQQGVGDERDGAADQRLQRTLDRQSGARALERDEDQGGDGRLADEQLVATEDHGGRHGQGDHDADLHRAGADEVDDRVGDHEADDDPADERRRALRALPDRRAEGDDGGDRREDRGRVGEQQLGGIPRGDSGDAVWTIGHRRWRRRSAVQRRRTRGEAERVRAKVMARRFRIGRADRGCRPTVGRSRGPTRGWCTRPPLRG